MTKSTAKIIFIRVMGKIVPIVKKKPRKINVSESIDLGKGNPAIDIDIDKKRIKLKFDGKGKKVDSVFTAGDGNRTLNESDIQMVMNTATESKFYISDNAFEDMIIGSKVKFVSKNSKSDSKWRIEELKKIRNRMEKKAKSIRRGKRTNG